MQNVEFKAELRDMDAARAQCRALKAAPSGLLRQRDTYFRMPDGRLKKRETTGAETEWVFYHRPNRLAPKLSNFTILTDPQARARWGTHSLRPWLVVDKSRELWLMGDVRIHLDEVARLGRFIEFEAPVRRGRTLAECHAAIARLREAFGPVLGEPISVGYCDLLAQESDDAAPKPAP